MGYLHDLSKLTLNSRIIFKMYIYNCQWRLKIINTTSRYITTTCVIPRGTAGAARKNSDSAMSFVER